jgi:hypothetical protein
MLVVGVCPNRATDAERLANAGRFLLPGSTVKPIPPLLVGLGASVWTRSIWWLLVGYLLEVIREPLQACLLAIAKQVGPAIGKRLAQRLRQSRRGDRRSGRR